MSKKRTIVLGLLFGCSTKDSFLPSRKTDAQHTRSGPAWGTPSPRPASGVARQRSEISSEPSIWPCLRPQIMEIPTFSSCEEIYSPADLRAEHFDQDELLGQFSLISLLCFSSSSLRSDGSISCTSHLKTCFAINSFAFKEPAFNPPPLLLYELNCSNGSSRALRVIAESQMRVSATKSFLNSPLGLV